MKKRAKVRAALLTIPHVADVLIVCGVILLAWLILTEKPLEPDSNESDDTASAANGSAA